MRTLVLLPGMEGSDLLFGPLRDAAPPDVRTIALQYPSGARNRYRDLLPLVRAALPTSEPYFVLGWSFSGPMALMVAADRPPGLRGVVLAATFVRRPVALPGWMRHLAQPWLFRFYPGMAQAKARLAGAEVRRFRHLLAQAHAAAGPAALACRVREAMAVDARALLASCPVPVLYLRATEDRLVKSRHADEARAIRPELRVADIPGPHMALVTNPRPHWDALTAFMSEAEAV